MESGHLTSPSGPLTTEALLERLALAVGGLPHLALVEISGRAQPPRSADPREVDSQALCHAAARFEREDGRSVGVLLLLRTWPKRCPRGAGVAVRGFLERARAHYALPP